MGRQNWDRPRFKTQGRSTESISGSDVPDEFKAARRLARSKAEQREEAERAVKEFAARKASYRQPLKPVSIITPLGDDDEVPF